MFLFEQLLKESTFYLFVLAFLILSFFSRELSKPSKGNVFHSTCSEFWTRDV